MQSPTGSNSSANPETEAPPAPGGPDAQQEDSESAAPARVETVAKPPEKGAGVQTEDAQRTPVTRVAENEPAAETPADSSGNADRALEPNVSAEPTPETKANPAGQMQKEKKADKGAREGRKYVLSKKAMIDPLKMDMSKQILLPLTCEYFNILFVLCHSSLNQEVIDLFQV